jgi:hypothetical protein
VFVLSSIGSHWINIKLRDCLDKELHKKNEHVLEPAMEFLSLPLTVGACSDSPVHAMSTDHANGANESK